jgi:hypothetical protein
MSGGVERSDKNKKIMAHLESEENL